MAINHLVFRPFDRGIEQEIVAHVRQMPPVHSAIGFHSAEARLMPDTITVT